MRAFSWSWSLSVRDKNGGYAIRIRQKLHACYTQTLLLCFMELELLLIKVLHCENSDFQPFLFFDFWPYMNLIRFPSRCTRGPKMNFLHQGFRKLSYYRQTDIHMPLKLYTTPLCGFSESVICSCCLNLAGVKTVRFSIGSSKQFSSQYRKLACHTWSVWMGWCGMGLKMTSAIVSKWGHTVRSYRSVNSWLSCIMFECLSL